MKLDYVKKEKYFNPIRENKKIFIIIIGQYQYKY